MCVAVSIAQEFGVLREIVARGTQKTLWQNAVVTERRFPPPWSIEELEACFVVKDSSKPAVWAKAAIRPHFQMKLVIQLYQGRRAA
jgi:hypothetical protein